MSTRTRNDIAQPARATPAADATCEIAAVRPAADASSKSGAVTAAKTSTPRAAADLSQTIATLDGMSLDQLRLQWRNHLGGTAPAHLPRWLLLRILGYRMQAEVLGDLDPSTKRMLRAGDGSAAKPFCRRAPALRDGADLKPGALLVREWRGRLERVMSLDEGFAWNGQTFGSLSQVAKAITGTSWNGHRFFGLKPLHAGKRKKTGGEGIAPRVESPALQYSAGRRLVSQPAPENDFAPGAST